MKILLCIIIFIFYLFIFFFLLSEPSDHSLFHTILRELDDHAAIPGIGPLSPHRDRLEGSHFPHPADAMYFSLSLSSCSVKAEPTEEEGKGGKGGGGTTGERKKRVAI
jgi:hypothetical protein